MNELKTYERLSPPTSSWKTRIVLNSGCCPRFRWSHVLLNHRSTAPVNRHFVKSTAPRGQRAVKSVLHPGYSHVKPPLCPGGRGAGISIDWCVWLTPSAKQRRNPCSGLPAVYPDLSTRHDWPVTKGLCFLCRDRQSGWREIRNALPVIRWVRWGSRTRISALLRRRY